jgi:DNA polymerase III alpha subunit
MPVGRRQCYDLEVANITHNFILPNGIVTSNSHSVAYTYLSGQLLYLKAHYKHEFYASILSYETLTDKIKEYKMEAKIHGVEICLLDINKSKITFELVNNEIVYGFSNVKGIGKDPAERIVAGQPYDGFEDFICRFGTDASVLKPLIGLRVFKERDPVTLWKFVEAYKEAIKKNDDRKKRLLASVEKYDDELKSLLPDEKRKLSDFKGDNPFDAEEFEQFNVDQAIEVEKEVFCEEDEKGSYGRFEMETTEIDGITLEQEVLKFYKKIKVKKVFNVYKELKKLWIKRQRTLDKFNNLEDEELPTLDNFDSSKYKIDTKLAKEFNDAVGCEEKYYGFAWIHELEKSPDYRGNLTFNELKNQVDCQVSPVELKILKINEKTSKKGAKFYQVVAEDATGQEGKINVWQDDMQIWHQEFTQGNLLRVRLQPPSNGFPTYLLESNSLPHARYKKKYTSKQDDPRVFMMRRQEKPVDEYYTDEEALDLFSNCIME